MMPSDSGRMRNSRSAFPTGASDDENPARSLGLLELLAQKPGKVPGKLTRRVVMGILASPGCTQVL